MRNLDFNGGQGTSSGTQMWSCGTALPASSFLDRSVSTSSVHPLFLLLFLPFHALDPAFSCTASSQIHSPRTARASRIVSCIYKYKSNTGLLIPKTGNQTFIPSIGHSQN